MEHINFCIFKFKTIQTNNESENSEIIISGHINLIKTREMRIILIN